ncbi:MAG TPA: DNA polymerase domain-containing protein [Nitrososphaeraceae archaeon]|nr:DNA polymerase domain-containing protein [Nitrososphaeraceae archaeon]
MKFCINAGGHLLIILTKDNFSPNNIKILSIDFETRQIREDGNNITRSQIFAAGFCSNTDFKEAIHLEDTKFNNDEVKFIRHVVYKIQSFQGIITGWYLADSDLVVLDEVCKHIGVESPVGFYEVPIIHLGHGNEQEEEDDNDNESLGNNIEGTAIKSYPYLKDKKVIDMYKVFHHNFIKNSVYPFRYRDLQLDTVATGMLEGYGKYVSESTGIKITGENVLQFPIEEQKRYVLRDAELVIKLIERNNYEILNILKCIADIAGLEFKQVCHAGVGKAWESIIYRMIQRGECQRPTIIGLKKRKYSGALVLEPETKSYTAPIEIFDVKGLYPTVMILHNLSFETVCCDCCKDDANARVPQLIMDTINNNLRQKIKSLPLYEREKRKERYWTCVKNKGAIQKVLLKFKEQREYYRQKEHEPMSQALKVMMNSIYGLFGSDGIFAFQDYRVAELVTAFARLKLLEMKQLANDQFQMNIIYGDTDSIFVSGISGKQQHNSVSAFISTCKQNLGVDVDHQNTFIRSMIIGKKHYIGIQPDGKVVIKGMEGKKRDRPQFFNRVFAQMIEDYKNNKPDLSFNILEASRQLEAAEVDPYMLAYSVILNKDPDDYQSYTPQHKIGKSLNKESGSIIKYYKTGLQEDGYKGYSTNYQDLNIDVYKLELWKRLHAKLHKIFVKIAPNLM